jgi:Conjugal transfer protein TraD
LVGDRGCARLAGAKYHRRQANSALKKLPGENMKENSDYDSRLKALREEQQRLERKQGELLDKRRAEIGKLVERLGLLEADDDALAGALLELKDASSKSGDERLARWRVAGASFRRKNVDRKAAPSRADNGVAQPDSDAARR